MKENTGNGSRRWRTLEELTAMLRGHIVCPECSTEASQHDLVEVIADGAYRCRCPKCGCEYLHEDDEE